jgi:tetratricopeptide (TPR) repeat protein
LKQGLKPLHDGENKRYPRKTMAQAESEAREQLERILSSPGFVHNERQSQFLRFVVERKLESRDNELKESVIGIEVFRRPPDYNPKRDAIVRTEAGRLRARLAEYYGNGGKRDSVLIELPKGGYVPVIRAAESQPELRITSATRPAASLVKVAIPLLIIFGLGLLWTLRKNASVTAHGWAIEQSTHRSANAYAPQRGAMNSQRVRRYEASPAYNLYLRARSAYHPAQEIPDNDVDVYQAAIANDPAFAPAYSGLALAYAFAASRPNGDRTNSLAKMTAAAERAVQIDPLLPEAQNALGVQYARLGLWEEAERSFRRAIELEPDAPAARLDFAMNMLVPNGWIGDALQQIRLAEQSDPISADVQATLAYILILAGQFDQAEEHCRKSRNSTECLGRIRIGQGRLEEALQILTKAQSTRYMGYAYGRAGRRKDAEKLAAISGGALERVLIYAGLQDKDRTFEALDRMVELGPVRVGRTLAFPELAFLRGDPRVKALAQKVGLPE